VEDWIVARAGVLGGKPCIKGTRISVEFILELLASGATQEQILQGYPQITAEGPPQATPRSLSTWTTPFPTLLRPSLPVHPPLAASPPRLRRALSIHDPSVASLRPPAPLTW